MIATWFYLGKLPKAPGTWGTIGAIPLVIGFHYLGALPYMMATVIFTALAMIVSHLYVTQAGVQDPKEVVIDEVVGFLITMMWLPMTWQAWAAGFALFRTLDILKPPPISTMDRKIKGGVGVVADDIMAGIIANIVLQYLFVNTNWLGYQLLS